MQCSNSVLVPNKARFFDSSTRHPLLMRVRCGKCANCQQNKAAEWYFRAYKEFESWVSDSHNNGNYVLFDTLTYREQHVPRLSYFEEFESLTKNEDMYCFMSEDLVQFHANLRSRLSRMGFTHSAYRYFIASEYGADDRYTHRPHYHCMFFVSGSIDPLLFSRAVHDSWFYGHTDGIVEKGPNYVFSNSFKSKCVGGRKVINYVTKYVQKSSLYMRRVEKRIKIVLNRLSGGDPLYFKSEPGKLLRRRLYNISRQFHRQSLQFGASALDDISPVELYERGYFVIRKSNGNFGRFPISQYYHRKLCYDKIWFDGNYAWSLKESALPLIELRKKSIRKSLEDYYSIRLKSIHSNYSVTDLVDFIQDYQGRNRAPFDVDPLFGSRFNNSDRFVYSCKQGTIITNTYLGNETGFLKAAFIGGNFISVLFNNYVDSNLYHESDCNRFAGVGRVLDAVRSFEKSVDASDDVALIKDITKNKYKQLRLTLRL